MRPSFLENYLENRGILTGQMGGMGTRKKYKITQNGRNIDFPEWKERRHSTSNEYLLSAYYVPSTVLEHP